MRWIYNRTQNHVDNLLSGSILDEDLERGCLSASTFNRWKQNIVELDSYLKNLGISIEHPELIDINENTPVIIRVSNPYNSIKVTQSDGSVITIESDISYNPIYAYFETLNIFIEAAGISLGLDIPKSTDYLTWQQLNNLEYASDIAFQSLKTSIDKTKLIYSGKIISGGYII